MKLYLYTYITLKLNSRICTNCVINCFPFCSIYNQYLNILFSYIISTFYYSFVLFLTFFFRQSQFSSFDFFFLVFFFLISRQNIIDKARSSMAGQKYFYRVCKNDFAKWTVQLDSKSTMTNNGDQIMLVFMKERYSTERNISNIGIIPFLSCKWCPEINRIK